MSDIEEKEMDSSIDNNNSVSDTSLGSKNENVDPNMYKKMIVETLGDPANVETDGNTSYEMKNFADATRSSIGSEGRRLDSWENISLSAVSDFKEQEDVFKEFDNETSKGTGIIYKKKGRSVDTFEPTEEVIEEEDLAENESLKNVKNFEVNADIHCVNGSGGLDGGKVNDTDAESSVVSDNDHWLTGDDISMDRSKIEEDSDDSKVFVKGEFMKPEGSFACRIMTLNDYGHMADLRRRSEGANKLLDEENNLREKYEVHDDGIKYEVINPNNKIYMEIQTRGRQHVSPWSKGL